MNIVCSIIRACESLLPVWTEPPLEMMKSTLEWIPVKLTCGIKGHITMPDGSNVRHYITGIMSEVQQAMLENSEDNTKSFFALIRVCAHNKVFVVYVYEILYQKALKINTNSTFTIYEIIRI